MKVRIKDRNLIPFLKHKMYATKHFENILLILIKEDHKQNKGKNFNYLTDGSVMRAVLVDSEGGKKAKEVAFIKDFYKDNKLMQDLIEISKELKTHNLVEQIKDIKKNYKGFFTKIKKGDTKARPPKPKKLSKVSSMTMFLDGYQSFTFKVKKIKVKNKNKKEVKIIEKIKLGINLNKKMKYTYINCEAIKKVVGKLENINNININYSNGFFYFLISYTKESVNLEPEKTFKYAGLDLGIINLLSIYIDDEVSKSLIVSGSRYMDYNSKFNRLVGKINASIDFNKNLKHETQEGLDIQGEIRQLYNFRKFSYEKRNNFFFSEFHKISKRILEYLKKCGVTHLVISENLGKLKNNGNCEMRSDSKQSFIQIPFMKIIQNIKDKASKFGITIVIVNEAYTSMTSCLSKDIIEIQQLFKANPETKQVANVLGGVRAERGLYKDKVCNKIINADLNGGCNIVKLGKLDSLKKIKLFKLCNPIKVKSDGELLNVC